MKLSICIPTYNREAYLRNALEYCQDYAFSFPYEIVISDNASTDGTEAMVAEFIERGLPIRYFRRETNGGATPNQINAFQHAVGEYTIYLADDDLLIAPEVENVVRYLDENSDVVAAHAPWTIYDEVQDLDISQFYAVAADRKFERRDFFEMFCFLFEGHIFPEIAIVRSSAMRSAWVPRELCFYAFSHLAHFLDMGAVTFLKTPFYRSVAVSKIAPSRQQAGFDDVVTSWDRYRGGLEYFLHTGAKRGVIDMSDESRIVYDQMCRHFMMVRMGVAIRFWFARKDYIKAYELCARMIFAGHGDNVEVTKIADTLPAMVGLQTLAGKVAAMTGIERLILDGMTDPEMVAELLQDLGVPAEVAIVAEEPAGLSAEELIGGSIVFVSEEARREHYLAKGYRPTVIFSDLDLTQHVLL